MKSIERTEIEAIGTQQLAEALIEANQGHLLADYSEYFDSLDLKELIRQLAQTGQTEAAQELLDTLSIEEQAELYEVLGESEDLPPSVRLFDMKGEGQDFSDSDSDY